MSKTSSKSVRGKRHTPRKLRPGTAPAAGIAHAPAPVGRIFDLLAHIAVPGLFVLFVWSWHPFHDVFEFDPDEGNNIIKALMVAKGHPLYSETWSDQPPLFTYMLRWWFGVTDWTVDQGRMMVLLCSSILLWALYHIIRPRWGRAAGFAAVLLLAASYRYSALSVAVMLAMPTLMLAMLAIYALARYRRKPHTAWVVASGVFVVLSLFTKMITLPVAVLVFLAMLQTAWSKRGDSQRKGRWLRPVLLWSGGFVGAGAVAFLLTIPINDIMQLIRPHLSAQEKMASTGFDQVFLDMVKADYAFALLGFVGLLRILGKRDWFSILAVVWCLMSYVLLWRHRPLWYHHYPLLAVPLCWTAGIGMGAVFSAEAWRACSPRRGLRAVFATLVLLLSLCFGVLAAVHIPAKFEREHEYAGRYVMMAPGDLYTVAVLRQFKDRTDYVVTDRQMLAFSAGIRVPPELSVTSVKRMRSGSLSMETLLRLLEEFDPGVVHLSWRRRIRMTRELNDYLETRYSRLYADPRGGRSYDRCYVRTDLYTDPVAVLETASAEVPESWEGHYNLGVQLAGAGRHEDAARSFESSIAIRPTPDALLGLGTSLKQVRKYDASADVFDRLAQRLMRGGRQDEADRARNEAKRLRTLDDG